MDKVYEAIEKIPEKFRYLIVLVVSLLVTALYVFLVRFPAKDKLASLESKLAAATQVYNEKKAIADDLQNWRMEVQRLEIQLQEALAQLPNQVDTDHLLINVPNIAKKNALAVSKFDLGAERVQGTYAEVPMALEMSGTYQSIGSFAQEIGDQPRIMAVRSLDLSRAPIARQAAVKAQGGQDDEKAADEGADTGVALSIKAEVITYRFVAPGEATAKPGAKGAAAPPKR